MKPLFITTLLLIGFAGVTVAQNNTYGISIGVGNGMIMKEALDGGPSQDLNTSVSIGFEYGRKLSNKLHLVTGLIWYNSDVTVTPSFHPDIDRTPRNYDLQLIYIPIFLKVDLGKYFFVNGGLITDFDISNDSQITSQSGLGTGFGIGAQFSIKEKFLIQINPYMNFHGLLLTHGETYPERVLDSGIKVNFLLKN